MRRRLGRLMSKMSRAVDFIADFFFPNRCPFCDRFIPYNRLCCDECAVKTERAEFCIRCGHHECQCGTQEILYDGCATVIPYVTVGREAVLSLKYHYGFNTAKLLVPELVKKLENAGFLDEADIITAVPMTASRRYETGYNHAEYIAKTLSKRCGLPTSFNLIKKNKNAPLQHELTVAERMAEAKKSYANNPKISLNQMTVILCDDIITTGSTLNACAGVLKSMGAKKVYCAVLAGSYRNKNRNKE